MNQLIDSTDASTIRPFVATDAKAVANLFQNVMLSTSVPASDAFVEYFIAHFLKGPFADPETPSLVHCGPNGTINGFAGVVVQPMIFEGRTIRVAIAEVLMVHNHNREPMAGARLIRRIVAGPQDLTVTETASDASSGIWRRLHSIILDRHSLDYIRVLRPAEFSLGMLAMRVGAARFLMPLARLIDLIAIKKDKQQRWTGLPLGFRPQSGVSAQPMTPEAFAQFVMAVMAEDTIVPVWPDDCLPKVIDEAMIKPEWGKPHLCEVVTRGGKQIGGFLLHYAGTGPARVVDVFHARDQAGPVLDALFVYARDLGAASVQGRTTPQVLTALLNRRVIFAHESASVIDVKDPALLAAFQNGHVHFNGLVGERWTRFIGGRFQN